MTGIAPIREVWGFPIRTPRRRRDMLVGGCLFLAVPLLGWILNLGHRWRVMERLYFDDPPWFCGFRPLRGTLLRGLGVVAMGIAYLGPGIVLLVFAVVGADGRAALLLAAFGLAAILLAFHAFPVAMARFAQSRNPRWLIGHRRAYREACQHGVPYVRMWALTWSAIALSVAPAAVAITLVWGLDQSRYWMFVGLLFPFLSPWAWSSLGYGFGTIIEPSIRLCDFRELERGESQ